MIARRPVVRRLADLVLAAALLGAAVAVVVIVARANSAAGTATEAARDTRQLNARLATVVAQQHRDLVAACERGNLLRAEGNRRAVFHRADTRALRLFARAARDARRAGGTREDERAARVYQHVLDLTARIHFFDQPLVPDCEHPPPPKEATP